MKQYLELLNHVLTKGTKKTDRTGTGTLSVFGHQMRFDLQEGFPLLTTKKLHTKSIIHELLWMISGDTNIKYLNDNGVKIWDEWANSDGDLGPVYGHQWRAWPGHAYIDREGQFLAQPTIDQIKLVVDQIKNNPDSRRLLVSAWNPADVDKMALPPCHCLFQFYTRPATVQQRVSYADLKHRFRGTDTYGQMLSGDAVAAETLHEQLDGLGVPRRFLDCQLYQRSNDIFLGVPFNIASYALLTHMIAQSAGMMAGEFVHSMGDTHIYLNHIDQVKLQLSRKPRSLPTLLINKDVRSVFDFKYEDFLIEGYDPHPHIAAPVSV